MGMPDHLDGEMEITMYLRYSCMIIICVWNRSAMNKGQDLQEVGSCFHMDQAVILALLF